MRDKMVNIAALVRDMRKKLNLTQEQFAHRVGVTYSTVNHWENGKRTPQPFLIRRLEQISNEMTGTVKTRSRTRPGKQK